MVGSLGKTSWRVAMKVYTGTGDKGKTSLFSGERLGKNDIRVQSYGEVDELCSFVGMIVSSLPDCNEREAISADLQNVQGDLFVVGALLAVSMESADSKMPRRLEKTCIDWLEEKIDTMEEQLQPLRSFILPGGHPSAACCHVARSVCRRAERSIVALAAGPGMCCDEIVLGYINRLSDFFFVLARYCNALTMYPEAAWNG